VEARAALSETESREESGQLADRIKQLIGISVTVGVRPPGSLPRSAGKASRIKDSRKN
jgi:phenylacetate-CoA ligase